MLTTNMKAPIRASLVASLLSAVSCTTVLTEEDSLQLSVEPLFYSYVEGPASGSRVLQGSQACISISRFQALDTNDWDACYAITKAGEVSSDEACVMLDQLGEMVVEYTPLDDCPIEELASEAVPDRYRLEVVPPDGLRARLEWWREELSLRSLHAGPGSFPADSVPAIDQPLRLVPDVTVLFPLVLVDAMDGHVAYDHARARVLEERAGASRELAPFVDDTDQFPLRIGAGERSTITLALPSGEVPVVEVIATPVETAASLEIVVAYDPGTEPSRWAAPQGARAIVRDAEGQVIYGAPVEWTLVEGHLVAAPWADSEVPSAPEYLAIEDSCVPPPIAPETRHAIVRAQLGELVDEVELEWTAVPEDEPSDEAFAADPACQLAPAPDSPASRGCECSVEASGAGATFWSVASIWALMGLRRRRRATSGARG